MRTTHNNQPNWRKLIVTPKYTGNLKGLDELSRNLWWSWNIDAVELFKHIKGTKKISNCIDPIAILKKTSYERFTELEKDKDFIDKYEAVYNRFQDYINTPLDKNLPKIAYFSMEYGMAKIMKIYSGGLGILAGDYLKQASDSKYNMVAVGLFYRQGYFTQKISVSGNQEAEYNSQLFGDLPAELIRNEHGEAITINIKFPNRTVYAQVWKVSVGRITLYLLDTDRNDNSDDDKKITYRLYDKTPGKRIQQEILLGIGGIKLLETLNHKQEIYHCNEGHAAFMGVERLKNYIETDKLSFDEALEVVRASTLFTTHTPVPAGHDVFTIDDIKHYFDYFPSKMNITMDDFIALGKENNGDKFAVSVLGANISHEINGVSKLHGEVTKTDIFHDMWDGYFPEELHIGYVTNGIHYPTWTAKIWQEKLKGKNGEPDFSKVYKYSNEDIWETRLFLKKRLVEYVRYRLDNVRIKRREDPKTILKIKRNLSSKALTIGFARRFATYKRGDLLFRDLNRLDKIINNPEMPVQFIFAGKAHPADAGGQAIIRRISEISKMPQFIGKILFLENYNMSLAKQLVQGVDIWLNTPTRPLEASGTSGMKAVMNGVMNFSVLDGWWVEGYKEGAGWALPEKKTYENQEVQNQLDAEMIYQTLENEIVPLFYKTDSDGIPTEWVNSIKKCVAEIAPEFTTKRMIDDYQERFYEKIAKRHANVSENNFEKAKKLSKWKDCVSENWSGVSLVSTNISEEMSSRLVIGKKYQGELVLNLNGILKTDIGVELVITKPTKAGKVEIISTSELKIKNEENGNVHYTAEIIPPLPGNFNYGFRVFPKNEMLPHRQDFGLVKWL